MDKYSYCATHDTYPRNGEPCWACVMKFGADEMELEKKIINDIQEKLTKIVSNQGKMIDWLKNKLT